MNEMRYETDRDIPVIAHADVVAIGGGPGGMGAAVMAARAGTKVLLIERYGALGGMASFGEVNPFMSNRLNGESLDRPIYVDWCHKIWNYLPPAERYMETFDEKAFEPETRRVHKDLSMLAMEYLCLYL
jgi:NADPH-dependent 2,4-dienoyl-CoA reductase/sulfur reductase-like enzyme